MLSVRHLKVLLATFVLLCSVFASWTDACSETAEPQLIRVGPDREIKTPSGAAKVAVDGAIVEIDAGEYPRDAAVWRQNNLTLRGVGGRAHLRSEGASVEGKAIWVIKGNNTRVENIEFSGARVEDRNGAGIRLQGNDLTVVGCSFHDNENGILSGRHPESVIVVERSEFANNGNGDGRTHNMYIGHAKSFTLKNSYVHHAKAGHNVKTRATTNHILYNRIMDEDSGTSSYAIDLPEGGDAFVVGNSIQQGRHAQNSSLINYSRKSNEQTGRLHVVHNTLVNDRRSGTFIQNRSSSAARIVNNIFAGRGPVIAGTANMKGNLFVGASVADGGSGSGNQEAPEAGFVDRSTFNYRLTAGSAAIDRALARATGIAKFEYVHVADGKPRAQVEAPDIGAFEFPGP